MDWFLYDNGARHEELNKSGTVPLKKKKNSQALKPNWLRNFNDSVADKTNYFATANNTIIPLCQKNLLSSFIVTIKLFLMKFSKMI